MKPAMVAPHQLRLRLTFLVFLISFGVLGFRAYQLHLRADGRVQSTMARQNTRQVVLASSRGTIFDRGGRALAVSVNVPSVFADPKAITDPSTFAKKVSPLLGVSSRYILRKVKNSDRRFVWLKRRLDPSLREELQALQLAGLHVVEESGRMYPFGAMAGPVLGFVGLDGDGLSGLERSFDRELQSVRRKITAHRDGRGRAIFSGGDFGAEDVTAADLRLTLDSTLQHRLERELVSEARRSGSRTAMGMVMDVDTGAVLAMASVPSSDPNQGAGSDMEKWRSRPSQMVFEPGSTFKVFTLAAALDHGSLDPTAIFHCAPGSLVIGAKSIRSEKKHDWLNARGILKYSDNIGTARIGLSLGRERLASFISKIGFGQVTTLELAGEERGLVRPVEKWRELDTAGVSFGQGIAVTMVQMVSALSVIANGGFAVSPHLVESLRYADGRVHRPSRAKAKRLISTETAERLRSWMESVTMETGTGAAAAIPGYRVGGKTGTSQKYDRELGRYSTERVVSSFFGFAPASAPRLVTMIVFDEPDEAASGGSLAAPVFRTVMESSLAALGVSPDEKIIPAAPPTRVVARSGNVAPGSLQPGSQGSDAESHADGASTLSEVGNRVPDFRGLTMREVLKKGMQRSLPLRVVGSGVAFRQEPPAGELFAAHEVLWVYFTSRGET